MIKLKAAIGIFFCLFIFMTCPAQTIEDEYYRKDFVQTANKSKAHYLKRITNYGDSILSVEITEIESNKLILKEFYKNGEAFGVWLTEKYGRKYAMNYNFILNYDEEVECERGHSDKRQIKNPFEDHNTWNYRAPRKNERLFNIYEYLEMNIVYPYMARKEGLEGKVILRFKISKNGEVTDVRVLQGSYVLLDKEAVRVLKLIKFDNPPSIGGLPQEMCLTIPFNFVLNKSNDRFFKFY